MKHDFLKINCAQYLQPKHKSHSHTLQYKGKWIHVSSDNIAKHPGGPVILQYANADITHIFEAFHAGAERAYKHVEILPATSKTDAANLDSKLKERNDKQDINISTYDITVEQEKNIVREFQKLQTRVYEKGLMEEQKEYYLFKAITTMSIFALSLYFYFSGWYFVSACVLALCWQQLGWMTHEMCHHQAYKDRSKNDLLSLFFGNIMQGFASDWWKDKHNTHHATTNMIDHDGDIDLAPLISFVPQDLLKYQKTVEKFLLKFIPYQHLYFTLTLPLLRFSWLLQSVTFSFTQHNSPFKQERENALMQQVGLVIHWSWVFLQLYYLPSWPLRIMFFIISQAGAGLLIAHVVTFNHNSVDKYPADSRILNNFAALQILTTRNMTPSPFIDWLWGGLNYQVEHHLFPTMPRCNLNACSKYVKEFCLKTGLPYLCDDFFVGYGFNLEQLKNMAVEAEKQAAKH